MLDASGQELAGRVVGTAPAIVNGPVSRPRTLLRSGRLRVVRDRAFDACLFVNDPLAMLGLQTCAFPGRNHEAEVLVVCRPAASVVSSRAGARGC